VKQLGHAPGGGTGGKPAWFEKNDLAVTPPFLMQEMKWYECRFTRTRGRRKNGALRPSQGLGDIAENRSDGKFGQFGLYGNWRSGHANRPAASGVVFERLIGRF
jgi:hypothetical protein